jgi:hypothetical protein
MWTGSILPKDAGVRHVAYPGEGMPIAGVSGGKSPMDALPTQPMQHHWVIGYIFVVIVINELGMQRRPIRRHRDYSQNQAYPKDAGQVPRLFRGGFWPGAECWRGFEDRCRFCQFYRLTSTQSPGMAASIPKGRIRILPGSQRPKIP